MSVSRRPLLINSALVVASIVLGLLALEVGLRALNGYPLIPDRNLILERMLLTNRFPVNEYHPVLGWVHKANLSLPGLSTGEFGVRMNQDEIRPLPRAAILAVGDSFTEGSDVGNAESWPAALERRLGEPVVNSGIGGYGPDQIVLRTEEMIPLTLPKAIIVSFFGAGLNRAAYSILGGGNKSYFVVEDGRLVHKNVPAPRSLQGASSEIGIVKRLLGWSYLVEMIMARLHVESWFEVGVYRKIEEADYIAVSCLLIDRLNRETKDKGISLLLVMQWGGDTIYSNERTHADADQVLDCAKSLEIPIVDSWPALREVRNHKLAEFRRFYTQEDRGVPVGHMSAAGNEFMAELIAQGYRRMMHATAAR